MENFLNRFVNISKMVSLGETSWESAANEGLIDISVKHSSEGKLDTGEHAFINMCSCSYLGLDVDQRILLGAKEAIDKAGTLHLTTARVRIYINLLKELEHELSAHFECEAMSFNSCAAATSAFLPLLASGVFSQGKKPAMVFDRHCHFSMKHIMPICGDETNVYTSPHNDLDYIEDLCKKVSPVAYVADGTYSMGGHTPIKDLLCLQDKYNLFLYIDDSHGLSITHTKGWGYAREHVSNFNDKTIIVASLAKAFGACGGVLMYGNPLFKKYLVRYGNSWSQYINSAGIGAILASLKIHQALELGELQKSLWENIALFDTLIGASGQRPQSPIRVLPVASPDKIACIAKRIFDKGYYTSPLFFPIVPRGTASLRVMPRANLTKDQIQDFCKILHNEDILTHKNDD